MALRVYFRDSNPAVDRFAFKLSDARGADLVRRGEGEIITLPDGRVAIQLFRRPADREQWIERFKEVKVSGGDLCPMPFLKVEWPESVKAMRAESLIPNVRHVQD